MIGGEVVETIPVHLADAPEDKDRVWVNCRDKGTECAIWVESESVRRARIAIVVDNEGGWAACGANGMPEFVAAANASDLLESEGVEVLRWIDVDLAALQPPESEPSLDDVMQAIEDAGPEGELKIPESDVHHYDVRDTGTLSTVGVPPTPESVEPGGERQRLEGRIRGQVLAIFSGIQSGQIDPGDPWEAVDLITSKLAALTQPTPEPGEPV